MTGQEVFDTVALHLLKQNTQSLGDTGTCRYRGPNGTKCSVGVLLPDDVYHPDMEGHTLNDLIKEFGAALPPILAIEFDLIDSLQVLHDVCKEGDWAKELRNIAADNKLSDHVIDVFEIQKEWTT